MILGGVFIVIVLAAVFSAFIFGMMGASTASAKEYDPQYDQIPSSSYSFDVTPIPTQISNDQSIDELKSSANKVLSYDEIYRNYKNHIGEVVNFRGRVIQVLNPSGDIFVFRIATDNYDDVLWVNYEGSAFLDYDDVELWGFVRGLKTYTSVLGNTVTIPEIDAFEIELLNQPTPRITPLPSTYTPTEIVTNSPFQRYYNNVYLFSVNYPINWYKSEKDDSTRYYKSSTVEFASTYSGDDKAIFSISAFNSNYDTLEDFYKDAVQVIDRAVDKTVTNHGAQTRVGGQPAYRIDYNVIGDDGNIGYKVIMIFTRWDEYYYIMTYSAPWPRGSGENLYNIFSGTAQAMIDSIELRPC
jgi:hypothetical protein